MHSVHNPVSTTTLDEDEDIPDPLPGVVDAVRPTFMLQWLLAFVEGWIFSREYSRVWATLPFLLMCGLCGGLLWWIRHGSDDTILKDYELAVDAAAASEDDLRQETYLQALVSLRPHDPRYRFRYALFLMDRDKPRAIGQLQLLAPADTDGYAPARLWLVEQAQREQPLLPLTEAEIENQLLKVVHQWPNQLEARRMLSDLYVRKSEWRLAEQHLTHAALLDARYCVPLAKLKKQLNRDSLEIQQNLEKGAAELLQRFESNPADVQIRAALAEARLLLDDTTEARQLLLSGLQQSPDDTLLRRALSNLELYVSAQKLRQSALNRDSCFRHVLSAMTADASNPAIVAELTSLRTVGLVIPQDQIGPVLQHWQDQVDAAPDEEQPRLMLSQLQAVSENPDGAIATLQPLVDRNPSLRPAMAKLLRLAGRQEESQRLLAQLTAELQQELAEAPDDPQRTAAVAEILLYSGRNEEALQLLRTAPKSADGRLPRDPLLRTLFGQACLNIFDERRKQLDSDTQPNEVLPEAAEATLLIDLLVDAVNSEGTRMAGVDRLARLAFSRNRLSQQAEEALLQLRTEGDSGAQMVTLIGTIALEYREFRKANHYLEQANIQTRGQNPVILNNLALTLVRSSAGQLDRALDMTETALRLVPNQPDFLSTRAEVLIALNRWTEAAADLEQALPSRKESRLIREMLVQTYTSLKDPRMADVHRQALEKLPPAPGMPDPQSP